MAYKATSSPQQYNMSKIIIESSWRLKMAHLNGYALPSLLFITLAILIGISSCASVKAPTGGPRDSVPPSIVSEIPNNLSRNFSANEITIEFDEFIKLTNEYTEISVTPAMDIPPIYRARKNVLEIRFEEALAENTTYTINFGKAVADVNETNILKNYTYVFATGDELDSLSLSGHVRSSLTKEKLKDVTVFILPTSQDSLFGKKRASFFTTTDTAGFFRLNNLREDTYRIYALNEQGGGDRIYNGQNEEIGFLNEPVHLDRNIDTIALEVFKPIPDNFAIGDRKIETNGRITLTFNRPLSDPILHIIDPPGLDELKTTEFPATLDSASLWLPELTFDSIKVAISDSSAMLDSVTLRRNKRDEYNREVIITDNITGSRLRPKSNILITLSAPAGTLQQAQISLLEDSVEVKNFKINRLIDSKRNYNLSYSWKLDKEYILRFSENAFTDIYGNKSKPYVKRFNLDTEENYGNMSVAVAVPDTNAQYIIQWMGDPDKILREDVISKNTTINYLTYPTGKYRIRIVYDANKNKRWDTGNVTENRQPEETWLFEKPITLRPNWDLEEKITIPDPDSR